MIKTPKAHRPAFTGFRQAHPFSDDLGYLFLHVTHTDEGLIVRETGDLDAKHFITGVDSFGFKPEVSKSTFKLVRKTASTLDEEYHAFVAYFGVHAAKGFVKDNQFGFLDHCPEEQQ